jgi:tetratricopeptide (TPR) repeat protein
VRRYPTNAAAEYYFALSLKDGDNDAAKDHFLRAIELKPDFPDAHYALGVLYQDEGNYRLAAAQLKISAAETPENSQVHYHLAQVYRKMGLLAKAQNEFAKVKAGKAMDEPAARH